MLVKDLCFTKHYKLSKVNKKSSTDSTDTLWTFIDCNKMLIMVEFDKTMVECMVGQYEIRQFKCWFHSNVKNLISSIFNR